jgi:hypothetical protein
MSGRLYGRSVQAWCLDLPYKMPKLPQAITMESAATLRRIEDLPGLRGASVHRKSAPHRSAAHAPVTRRPVRQAASDLPNATPGYGLSLFWAGMRRSPLSFEIGRKAIDGRPVWKRSERSLACFGDSSGSMATSGGGSDDRRGELQSAHRRYYPSFIVVAQRLARCWTRGLDGASSTCGRSHAVHAGRSRGLALSPTSTPAFPR